MFENPNPCLMCCSVRNYLDLSGLLGRVKQRLIATSTNMCGISTVHICCKLPENPKDILTLSSFKFTFNVPRYSKQYITFVRVDLHLALQCTLTLILLF